MISAISKQLAGFLPQYGRALWALLTQPRAWVEARARSGFSAWEATTFWAASYVFFIVTRFLVFERKADPFAFVAAAFLTDGLHLLLTALAFWALWRAASAQLQLPQVITAAAYCIGAVMPFQVVLVILMFAAIQFLSPEAFVITANILNGCADIAATLDLFGAVTSGALEAGWLGIAALALYAIAFFALSGVFIFYSVVFVQVLRRLAPVGTPVFLLFCASGFVLWLLAGMVSAVIDVMLLSDTEACLQVSDILQSGGAQ
ncbi:hypothetical protein [Tropicimonas sp. S265A]|uniref:hypothetical protein n=1 Tax=Tropicimonas sp. S265A TaxID=3415134 RepID=UPI003C7A2048